MIAASAKDTVVPKPKPKRKTPGIEAIAGGGSRQKRPKMMMDRAKNQNCSALLKAPKKHAAAGMVFNPEALKKSDYFTTTENPMDFGTTESKLAKNTYVGIEEFAADIRLTFSNAMYCYPAVCEEMNVFFEARLKSMEENWDHQENLKVGGGKDVRCSKEKLNRKSLSPYWKPSESEVPWNEKAVEVELPKPVQNSVSKSATKKLRKGSSGRAHGSINAKSPASQGSIESQRSSNQASSGVVTSERSSSKLDSNVCLSSVTDAASGEGLLFEAQTSPKKALRAAMLKSRYADTIVKAQLLVKVDKADPRSMEQEKEKLERKLREEMAEAEAEAEFELKKQREREREREAARISLQKMENTAGIELNLEVQREFEILIGCSPSRWNWNRSAEDEYLEK